MKLLAPEHLLLYVCQWLAVLFQHAFVHLPNHCTTLPPDNLQYIQMYVKLLGLFWHFTIFSICTRIT